MCKRFFVTSFKGYFKKTARYTRNKKIYRVSFFEEKIILNLLMYLLRENYKLTELWNQV